MQSRDIFHRRIPLLLALILALAIARLWIIQLPVSFWTDEMVTVFVVHHGADHPSLAVAPQVSQSIYYALAAFADRVAGVSEIGYRIPSILAMGLALFFIARLAARLIHPDAAWFAAFACLGLKSLDTEATDARPYALGICVSAAALFFLVRWLDSPNQVGFKPWLDAIGFFIAAALLWRVHLTYWPFYFVFAIYAVVRLARRDTRVPWPVALAIFVALGVALLPVAHTALLILREAQAHVIAEPPTVSQLLDSLKWKLLVSTLALATCFKLIPRVGPSGGSTASAGATGEPDPSLPGRNNSYATASSIALIVCWWLIYPLTLFAFSRITGDSLFIPRYLSLALPGAAIAATFCASRLMPSRYWKFAAMILGMGILLTVGNWRHPWTAHANSDWRAAAVAVNRNSTPETPVICLSPFVEAKSPEWQPNYTLPGFLYSYLPVYPITGRTYLFPFGESQQAEEYAHRLLHEAPLRDGRFFIYGRDRDTKMWTAWFAKQPELAGWNSAHLGKFGDVDAVLYQFKR